MPGTTPKIPAPLDPEHNRRLDIEQVYRLLTRSRVAAILVPLVVTLFVGVAARVALDLVGVASVDDSKWLTLFLIGGLLAWTTVWNMRIDSTEDSNRPAPLGSQLRFERLTPTAIAPVRAHASDAGFDLHADEYVTLAPGEFKLVKTGVAIALPDGTAGLVCPRSGLAGKYGITVLNAPGIVDAGFRGEWRVILINHSDVPFGINPGDRIAQLVIVDFQAPTFVEADVVNETTDRGINGFGSTGVAA